MSVLVHTPEDLIAFNNKGEFNTFIRDNHKEISFYYKDLKPVKDINGLNRFGQVFYYKNQLYSGPDKFEYSPLSQVNQLELWDIMCQAEYDVRHLFFEPKKTDHDGDINYQVFAKTLTGKTYTLNINNGMRVHHLKQLIKDKHGMPIDQQDLVFNHSLLDNKRKLSYYGIKKESTLNIVCKLRGGMHHGTSFPSNCRTSLLVRDFYGKKIGKIEDLSGKSIDNIKQDCQIMIKKTFHKELIENHEKLMWQKFFHIMDQWRKSDEAQELFEIAEKTNDTDWIDCVKPKQLQLAREIGFEGSDEDIFKEMTKWAHLVDDPPLCVKFNRAGACKTDTGDAVAEISLVKQSDMSETTLQQLAEQSEKKTVVVAAGSFT